MVTVSPYCAALTLALLLPCGALGCSSALGVAEAESIPPGGCGDGDRAAAIRCALPVHASWSIGCSRGGFIAAESEGVLSLQVSRDGRALLRHLAEQRIGDTERASTHDLRWVGRGRWIDGALHLSLLDWQIVGDPYGGRNRLEARCVPEQVSVDDGGPRVAALVCRLPHEPYPLRRVAVPAMPFTTTGSLRSSAIDSRRRIQRSEPLAAS